MRLSLLCKICEGADILLRCEELARGIFAHALRGAIFVRDLTKYAPGGAQSAFNRAQEGFNSSKQEFN